MFRRGIIEQQIQEMARVMRALNARLSAQMLDEPDPDAFSDIEQRFMAEANRWIALPLPELEQLLEQDIRFDAQNIELLADWMALQRTATGAQQRVLWCRSLELYQYANVRFKTFSLSRQQKISAITARIETH